MFVYALSEGFSTHAARMLEEGNVGSGLFWLVASLSLIVASMIYCGLKGNDWRMKRLERKGYSENVRDFGM